MGLKPNKLKKCKHRIRTSIIQNVMFFVVICITIYFLGGMVYLLLDESNRLEVVVSEQNLRLIEVEDSLRLLLDEKVGLEEVLCFHAVVLDENGELYTDQEDMSITIMKSKKVTLSDEGELFFCFVESTILGRIEVVIKTEKYQNQRLVYQKNELRNGTKYIYLFK